MSQPTTADWRRLAARELGREPEDVGTVEGIGVRPVYAGEEGGLPGLPPYTRGARASMYAGRPWTIRQYAGFSTAAESNAFFRTALAAGQTGISVAFDLATHRGYDSDHPRVAGDVGKAGVAIDSVEDMKVLFDGIPLGQMSVSMTMNGAVLPVLAGFIVAGEEQGVAAEKLSGTIQNDILKEFMVRNTYIYPPGPSLRIVGDVIEYTAKNMPRFNAVSISGYHMQEAGATLVQELGFTLADGREYVRAAIARGLRVDDFAPRLSFFFGIGMDLFMEVAKLRAARLLWHRVMAEFGPGKPESSVLRMHCQTSGVSLQAQDPLNNITRTAYEALAAVLGGTQSLHTNSFDEALALPSDDAARIARNTQLILQHETGVTRTADPLGGSYYVESLTEQMAAKAWALMEEVEALGGMVAALEAGMPKARIAEAAAKRQASVDRGETVIVGVNRFQAEGVAEPELRDIDHDEVRRVQAGRLKLLRAGRDGAACEAALAALEAAGRSGQGNLLALSVEAMRTRATLGEVSEALERAFGRHVAEVTLRPGVYAGAMEGDAGLAGVRDGVAGFVARHGRAPAILVAKLGQDGHDRGAQVIASAFADFGFRVVQGGLFRSPEEAADEAVADGVDVAGLSSLAAGHRTLAPQLVRALRDRGGERVIVVCGGVIPQADAQVLRQHGVKAVFGPGTNVMDAAREVLRLLAERADAG